METRRIISEIENGNYDNLFLDIYVDENKISYQKQRYVNAIESYIEEFGEDDVEIYSAPGRSEVGGNHTDHQRGEILAADLHHIKKENIGLIEVMGLAVLPARLKKEMAILEEYILEGKDIRSNEDIEKHADWVEEGMGNYSFNKDNIHDIIQDEISKVFVKVLECAGVYKRTEDGMEAFMRFVNSL